MSHASVQRVIRHVGGVLPIAPGDWYVLVDVADSGPELEVRLQDALARHLESGSIMDAALATSIGQSQIFWALRENMGEAERHAGRSVKHDVAVSVSDVPAFIEAATLAVRQVSPELEVNPFGHVGDGNIHFNVLGSEDEKMDCAVNRAVHDVVCRFNGSIAAEHGIGQYRIAELLRCRSGTETDLMQQLKTSLDPFDVLNPGKVVPLRGGGISRS
jgi:FAD/FMN-containing dehydrogenase